MANRQDKNQSAGSGQTRTSKNDDKRGTSGARQAKESNLGDTDSRMWKNKDKPAEGDVSDIDADEDLRSDKR